MTFLGDLSAAARQVRRWLGTRRPRLAIILGTGLADVASQLENPIQLSYQGIDGFPPPGVAGHAGRLFCGILAGEQVLVFEGRYHVYEGYSAWQVTAPVRLAAALGCQYLLLTNAVGGIAATMQAGDFMLVTDHLNLTGHNPLIGRPEADFVDLSDLYTTGFFAQLQQRAGLFDINLHSGVLAWMLGPNFETPAEIRALQCLGADAVTMSTVPEAIVSGLLGLETVALSFISNQAAGCQTGKLEHRDVLNSGRRAAGNLSALVDLLIPLWLQVN